MYQKTNTSNRGIIKRIEFAYLKKKFFHAKEYLYLTVSPLPHIA